MTSQLRQAGRRTDELFRLLAPPALYERAVAERRRFVFYLGHGEPRRCVS